MDIYLGTIVAFVGNYEPQDWKFCNGQLLNISDYQALYSLLGTTYGGNGSTNFALPDLRNRLVVGAGNGTGLTPRTLGQTGGADNVTLQAANLPPHTHGLIATKDVATSAVPASNSLLATVDDTSSNFYDLASDTANPATLQPLNSVSVTNAGNGQSHENRQPFMALNYIICVNGLYPTFN